MATPAQCRGETVADLLPASFALNDILLALNILGKLGN
jgi:hypothetical protein